MKTETRYNFDTEEYDISIYHVNELEFDIIMAIINSLNKYRKT